MNIEANKKNEKVIIKGQTSDKLLGLEKTLKGSKSVNKFKEINL